VGAENYAAFAVYWSALFIVVGALGGVQQETARATSSPSPPPAVRARLLPATVVAALALFVLIIASSPLWSPGVFTTGSGMLALPLAVGASAYVVVAVVSGAFYGIRAWWALVAMITVDGVLRLAGVLIVLALGGGTPALGWAVVAPFPLAILIIAPVLARQLRSSVTMDVGYRDLAWNVARTLGATIATASLISGFPLLLRLTSPGVAAATLAPLILTLTLTRAPIVIPLLSLQSLLIVQFTDNRASVLRRAVRFVGLVIAASLVLAALAALIGPTILVALFGSDYAIAPVVVFVLVASSGLIASLCVSGPALLSLSRHSRYVAGWAIAAVATVGFLVLPVELDLRVSIALVCGPLLGLALHLTGLRSIARQSGDGVAPVALGLDGNDHEEEKTELDE
jgi:hypothetical protein